MTNYFLLYTPFHAEYAVQLARLKLAGQTNIFINHFRTPLALPPREVAAGTYNVNRGVFQMMGALRRLRRKMTSDARAGNEITVFMPHTLAVMANYAFHVLARKYDCVKIAVFYEGVILFYDYRHRLIDHPFYYFSRMIVSALIGTRYVYRAKLLDLADRRVARIYTPFPTTEAPSGKTVLVPLPAIQYDPLPGVVVILGLSFGKGREAELNSVAQAICGAVAVLRPQRIYYKDHPLTKSAVFGEVARSYGLKLEMIADTAPIEKIIHRFRPAHVFSSWSSGLVNLRSIAPGGTRLHCFMSRRLTASDPMKKLSRFIENSGISVTYVE